MCQCRGRGVVACHVSEVATDILTILFPSWERRISGSRPRLPTRITLLTLPAMAHSLQKIQVSCSRLLLRFHAESGRDQV